MRHPTLFICQVLVAICLLASSSQAQVPTLPPIPPGEDRIQFLPEGRSAPYSGQLFDNDTALRWGNWLKQWKLRYEIDLNEQARLCANDRYLQQYRLELEQEKYNRMVATYQQEVTRLNTIIQTPTPWYQSPWVYVGVGVVGTVAVVGLGAYLAP